MKKGKEIKLNLPYNYTITSGTVDNKNPKSIYIQISSWGELKNEVLETDNFDRIIKNKSKKVKSKLFEIIDSNQFYKDKFIVDFNMASSGVSNKKRSYMAVEMTLFQKKLDSITSKELEPHLYNISEKIIKDIFEKDEDFKFYKHK